MRATGIAHGSAVDRLNAVSLTLAGLYDREALRAKAPALTRCLQSLVGRRGPGLAEATDWLREVVRHRSRVLQEPGVASIRDELLTLAERISPAPKDPAEG